MLNIICLNPYVNIACPPFQSACLNATTGSACIGARSFVTGSTTVATTVMKSTHAVSLMHWWRRQ